MLRIPRDSSLVIRCIQHGNNLYKSVLGNRGTQGWNRGEVSVTPVTPVMTDVTGVTSDILVREVSPVSILFLPYSQHDYLLRYRADNSVVLKNKG